MRFQPRIALSGERSSCETTDRNSSFGPIRALRALPRLTFLRNFFFQLGDALRERRARVRVLRVCLLRLRRRCRLLTFAGTALLLVN